MILILLRIIGQLDRHSSTLIHNHVCFSASALVKSTSTAGLQKYVTFNLMHYMILLSLGIMEYTQILLLPKKDNHEFKIAPSARKN